MSARTVTPGRWTLETVPRLLVECRVQAAAYGRCVSADATGKTELRKGACAKEFEELKQCINKAFYLHHVNVSQWYDHRKEVCPGPIEDQKNGQ